MKALRPSSQDRLFIIIEVLPSVEEVAKQARSRVAAGDGQRRRAQWRGCRRSGQRPRRRSGGRSRSTRRFAPGNVTVVDARCGEHLAAPAPRCRTRRLSTLTLTLTLSLPLAVQCHSIDSQS